MSEIITKYKVGTFRYDQLDGLVELPKYQRRLVWSKKDKVSFVETLRNRYPFGSILVYKYLDSEESKFSLIDGLQRYTTIKDFVNNKHNYVDIQPEVTQILELCDFEYCTNQSVLQFNKQIRGVLTNLLKTNEPNLDVYQLFYDLQPLYLPYLSVEAERDIVRIQANLISKAKNYLELDKLEIPYIEFLGGEDELATVFENLNRGGKKLSKYQVFAAQWSKHEFKLENSSLSKKMLNYVIDRYTNLTDSRQIEISDFDEDKMSKNGMINMSEFCYALGKVILDEMNSIWSRSSKNSINDDREDLANEIGYSTIAMTMGISNKNLSEIINNVNVFKNNNNNEFIETYIESILTVYKSMNETFKKNLREPGHIEKYVGNIGTNFQLFSFFAMLWKTKHDFVVSDVIEIKPKYSNLYNSILNNMISHYLYDSIRNYWSGSGDSKLDNILFGNDDRYSRKVDKLTMERTLMDWWDDRRSKASINFDDISKAIYTIQNQKELGQYGSEIYEYEHIISRASIRSHYKEHNLPMGSLGNMMFLDKRKNRSIGEFSLYETVYETETLDDNMLRVSFYPEEYQFNEAKKNIADRNFEDLLNTLRKRGNQIIDSLLDTLYN